MKESELKRIRQKLLLKKEREKDYQSFKEMQQMTLKSDLKRKEYYDNIYKMANKYNEKEVSKIISQMKMKQKEENDRMKKYLQEKKIEDDNFQKYEKIKKIEDSIKMRQFYDMQVEEKKKERDLEKAIDNEQARIWNIDHKKYEEEVKNFRKVMMDLNKKNIDQIIEEAKKKKANKYQKMTEEEYAMNREALEKAKIQMDEGKK